MIDVKKLNGISDSDKAYRLYSDGYLEQEVFQTTQDSNYTVSLSKSYSDTNYGVTSAQINNNAWNTTGATNQYTASSIQVRSTGNSSRFDCRTSGYTSSKGLTYKIIKY